MNFEYKAKDFSGKNVEGVVEAPSIQVAADILKDKKYIIISLREKRKSVVFASSFEIFSHVPLKELVIFSRQLSVMINSGVPLVRALRISVGQTGNVNLKVVIADVADEVEGGAKFSTSLARYPKVFDNFFVQMIRSGETTGKLDETLTYLADQKEKDYDFISKIRGSMMYPAFVLGLLFVVGAFMMVYVMPKLTSVLEGAGVELPWTTKTLIATSNFLSSFWWVVIVFALIVIVVVMFWKQTPIGRRFFDIIKVRFPIIGGLYKKIYLTRFARGLSTLLGSGIPLSTALAVVADVVDNLVYKDVITKSAREIEKGNSIATAFLDSGDVPIMIPQMMRIGEQTGKLDMVLNKVADFYARESEAMVQNLATLIEPLVIVALGFGVFVLIAGVLLPMYNLSAAL